MKRVSNKFRDSLRGVRRLSAIVGYYTNDSYFILTTEDNKAIQTEDGNNLVTTETGIVEYDEGVINNVNVLFNTSLLKTTCKSVQIDCNNKIDVGTKINVRIGVYIEEDDEFEYVNYGDFYIIDEPVYQADTKSYLITAYDKMVQSMVDYDSNPLNITYPITHKNLIKAICDKLGWEEELDFYNCELTEIKEDIYKGQGLTYRDILDDLNGAMVGSLMFAIDNQLVLKQPTETNLIIEDEDLKDTNVDFGDKYGPVNALVISSNKDVIIDNKEDSTSIEQYGKTEFKLNDNLLMIKQSDDFIDDLFTKINGLEYNIFDVSSTGILILEPLDIFTFRHDGVDYKTIMLNDDIQLSQGLEENLYVEKPKETESEYIANDKNEKKLNNAVINIDKANAELVLKADSDGKVVQARLDADADEGSIFEVKADNIKLEGYTTINDGFSVDVNGNMICKDGTFNGGDIELYQEEDDNARFTIRSDKDFSPKHRLDIYDSGIYNYHYDDQYFSLSTIYNNEGPVGGSLSLSNANGKPTVGINGDDNGFISLFDDNGVSIIGLNGSNGNIYCVSLTQTSKEESKKNFEKYENALEQVKKTDIYKYNLKNEDDEKKKHIGFVIGKNFNYSHDITAINENNEEVGVDTYSMVSVLWQAVKEQQEQIEELQKEIKSLKGDDI